MAGACQGRQAPLGARPLAARLPASQAWAAVTALTTGQAAAPGRPRAMEHQTASAIAMAARRGGRRQRAAWMTSPPPPLQGASGCCQQW